MNFFEAITLSVFTVGVLFYVDFRFNQAKIVTYLAHRFF